jgi:hydrogenase expression/formation protein HypE
MRRLIAETLTAGFPGGPAGAVGLSAMDDGAAFPLGDRWLVVTTDSHVVHPIFFAGGDIGRLAVAGTVNDLAMMGATEPLGLTFAAIIEDGVRRADLERIQRSMAETCRAAGVTIVTGDTKVMGRGELDGIVINTTGIALTQTLVRDSGLRAGDRLILTGSIGDHGIALMAQRHALALDADLTSDVAPINGLIQAALEVGGRAITAMKDPTRGGVASALHEMADKSALEIVVHEPAVPVSPMVRSAAEMLGLDPFHIANEGKALIGVSPERADAVLAALRTHPLGREAAIIGECGTGHPGRVVLDTGLGRRLMQEPEGEPLPRIC